MGENCTGNSRIIVPVERKVEFIEGIKKNLVDWAIGNPLDPANALGSMVSYNHFKTVMKYIEKAKEEGATAVIGGDCLDIGSGLFISPTIFDNVKPSCTIAREEIFGPVTAVMGVSSNEEGIALANNSEYGLQAILFTNDLVSAHQFAKQLQAGTVSVNCFSEGDNTTPFGGYKLSGFGGKDKGRESHEQYTSTKTIFINIER